MEIGLKTSQHNKKRTVTAALNRIGGYFVGKIYGYARVSSKDQNESRQIIALTQYGVERKNLFVEKQSGKNFERPNYKNLIKKLKTGDVIVIKSIDRLGRNYEEILEQWRIITKEKGADFVVLDMPLLDTRNGKDLVGTLISDIVLQLLSYVAQTEREYIHQRQAEGIAAARNRGVHLGRKPLPKPENYIDCFLIWKNGEITAMEAAKRLNVSRMTFVKWANNSLAEEN